MDDKTKLKVDLLHDEAQERQKKQRFKQIILPTIIAGVLLLAVLAVAIVLAVTSPKDAGYKAGQIALILVLSLALLIGLILIWALVKAISGLYKLNRDLPKYGKTALGGVVKVEEGALKVANASVEPIIRAHEMNTKLKQAGKSFKDRITRKDTK